jgi:hypothetical protein
MITTARVGGIAQRIPPHRSPEGAHRRVRAQAPFLDGSPSTQVTRELAHGCPYSSRVLFTIASRTRSTGRPLISAMALKDTMALAGSLR